MTTRPPIGPPGVVTASGSTTSRPFASATVALASRQAMPPAVSRVADRTSVASAPRSVSMGSAISGMTRAPVARRPEGPAPASASRSSRRAASRPRKAVRGPSPMTSAPSISSASALTDKASRRSVARRQSAEPRLRRDAGDARQSDAQHRPQQREVRRRQPRIEHHRAEVEIAPDRSRQGKARTPRRQHRLDGQGLFRRPGRQAPQRWQRRGQAEIHPAAPPMRGDHGGRIEGCGAQFGARHLQPRQDRLQVDVADPQRQVRDGRHRRARPEPR